MKGAKRKPAAARPPQDEPSVGRGPDAGRGPGAGNTDRLAVLAAKIAEHRKSPPPGSRTAKLIAGGLPKMAQKVVEEAAEIAIDAVRGERGAVVREGADFLYNLTVLLSELGIEPAEVWAEMDRRHAAYGIAEKIPKSSDKE